MDEIQYSSNGNRVLKASWTIDTTEYQDDFKHYDNLYYGLPNPKHYKIGKGKNVKQRNKLSLHNWLIYQHNKRLANVINMRQFATEMINIMSDEIREEIDKQIISELIRMHGK